ncbi:hypothetical protein ACFL6I_14665 [candidate division KSB1 bacterium]
MKKILQWAVSIFCLFYINVNLDAQQVTEDDVCLFCKGNVLVYQVEFYGSEYLYFMNIIENTNDQIKFRYLFSSDGRQGLVTMDKKAIKYASNLYNYFSGGDVDLTNQTSAWFSRNAFEELKEYGETIIDPGSGTGPVKITHLVDSENTEYYIPAIDHKYGELFALPMIEVVNADKEYKFMIYDDPKNPIGLYMDLGWKIYLIAIL